MRLSEHEAKKIFDQYDIEVPRGVLIADLSELYHLSLQTDEYMVKAQVPFGKRKKSGYIESATKDTVKKVVKGMLGKKHDTGIVGSVLVEEKVTYSEERYVSVAVDREQKGVVVLFSQSGGIDIEELATSDPEKVHKVAVKRADLAKAAQLVAKLPHGKEVVPVVRKLCNIFLDFDATLVEINPLVCEEGVCVALDAKIIVDDNAVKRHPELFEQFKRSLTPIERKAREAGMHYVGLDGDVAVIGNGAGLVMASIDEVAHYGGNASCFIDVGGGASVERVESALEVAMVSRPKGALINIFGGITRCDEVAQGIVDYLKHHKVTIPVVVRMIGTKEDEGKAILEKGGIRSLDSMDECAKKIVELTR